MSFGKFLKEIRLKNKDSLRSLAEKMELHFTFIDKIEKGTAPISEILPKMFQNEDAGKVIENDKILNLPVYGKASAGRGYINMESPDYYMPVLKGNFSKRSYFVEITGNSMYPTLEDGQFALVDPDNLEYVKNKIYVITYNDETYIKRLEVKEKLGIISLKSDNPEYDDIDISGDMQEYFRVNGRVVEVISKKKLL